MKRELFISVAIASLLIASCTSTDSPTPEVATQPTVANISQGDQGSETLVDEASPSSSAAEIEEASPTPEESPAITDQAPTLTERGNVLKEINESAYMVNMATGEETVELKITEIVPDFQCTYDYYEAPINGLFLGLHFDVKTTAGLAEGGFSDIWISNYDFSVWDATGKRVNDAVGNAYICLEDKDELPSSIGPAEHADGWIVLDVPTATGAFAFSLIPGSGGWEWYY